MKHNCNSANLFTCLWVTWVSMINMPFNYILYFKSHCTLRKCRLDSLEKCSRSEKDNESGLGKLNTIIVSVLTRGQAGPWPSTTDHWHKPDVYDAQDQWLSDIWEENERSGFCIHQDMTTPLAHHTLMFIDKHVHLQINIACYAT